MAKIMVKYGPDDPDVHAVELKRINILAHRGERDVHIVEAPNHKRVVMVASPATIEEGKHLDPHWAFWAFWEHLREPGGVKNLPSTIEEIKRSGTGFTHLAGLVNIMTKLTFEEPDTLAHVRYPEAHLHPSVQVALADLFIALQFPIKTVVMHLTHGRKPILALPKELIADEEEES